MATYQSIFVAQNGTSFTVGAASSSGDVFPMPPFTGASPRALFAIQASAAINIRFGNAGMSNATVADWQIPGGAVQEFDLSDQWDRIRIFSTAGATVWILPLYRS